MSKIVVNSITGGNNVLGDHNTVNNGLSDSDKLSSVLTRDEYFNIIEEIRNIAKISLDDYMQERYNRAIKKNPHFVKLLYKDIHDVLYFKNNASKIVIENGDLVIENGDIKIYPEYIYTNLDYAYTWLHMQLISDYVQQHGANRLHQFDVSKYLFEDLKNSPSVNQKIKEFRKSVAEEKNPIIEKKWSLQELNKIFTLKPGLFGMSIDINTIISKLLSN